MVYIHVTLGLCILSFFLSLTLFSPTLTLLISTRCNPRNRNPAHLKKKKKRPSEGRRSYFCMPPSLARSGFWVSLTPTIWGLFTCVLTFFCSDLCHSEHLPSPYTNPSLTCQTHSLFKKNEQVT
jgi:hypothetical protein